MTCHNCRIDCAKDGKRADGQQRYRCNQCGKKFSDRKEFGIFGRKQLDEQAALLALQLLVEGNSIRSAQHISGLNKKTILKLLVDAGQKCETFLATRIRNIAVREVQADEIWSFVGKKESHKWPWEAHDDSIGDAWCFIGIERHTKLVLAFEVGGKRDYNATHAFIKKIAAATSPDQKFQFSTDGHGTYSNSIHWHLGDRVSYGQVIKTYAAGAEAQARYSPPDVTGAIKKDVFGNPDESRICTSHVERKNGSLRQWCKRLTRLSYAFSKKMENLRAALALHFAHYNFCRVHSSIKMTPAMASGITGRALTLAELLA